VRDLNDTNANLEEALERVRHEHAQLVQYIEKLGYIGKNIQRHVRNVGAEDDVSERLQRRGPWEGRDP